jgi:hypothetical protein
MADDRNKKGQFKPGYKGGPGRGNKKDRYPWADDPAEFTKRMASMARRELAAMFEDSDKKVRQDALKLHARYLGMETEARASVLDPVLMKGFGKWFFENQLESDGEKAED